jgi:hypothetical protein
MNAMKFGSRAAVEIPPERHAAIYSRAGFHTAIVGLFNSSQFNNSYDMDDNFSLLQA